MAPDSARLQESVTLQPGYVPWGAGTAREAGAKGWHAQVQQLLLTRPLSAQLGVRVQVAAVHEDLAHRAGRGCRRRGWLLAGAWMPSRMFGTPGPRGGLLGGRGGQGGRGTQQLEGKGERGCDAFRGIPWVPLGCGCPVR